MTTQPEAAADAALSPREKLLAIRKALVGTYVERDDAIDALLLGAVAQQHVLFLGPPGTGKSHLVTSLARCITGCDTFVTLLTKFTSEDELCGPAKLSALKLDRFERATAGHLPSAHVAFLDEVFKANAAVLNATLSITNERIYKGQPCPLRFLCGASNELPEDEGLGAMYDRFLLRVVVDYVQADAEWIRLLASEPSFTPPCQLSLTEWDQATAEARQVKIGRPVLDELAKVRATLAKAGLTVSDRRWVQLLGVLRAAAYLDGDPEVAVDHLLALRFGLWSKPEERGAVTATLHALPAGPVRTALAIIDEALRTIASRPVEPAAYFEQIPKLLNVAQGAAKRVREIQPSLTRRGAERVNVALGQLGEAAKGLKTDMEKRISAASSI